MYKITVGICCYKQKNWLHRCLRSLSSQSISKDDFEVIIVNDDPYERLDTICDNFKDFINIRIINNEDILGLPKSLNKILSASLGKYFVRVDSDDYVSKHFLYMLSTFLFMNRSYQAVACDYKKVNDVGESIIPPKTFPKLHKLGFYSAKDKPMACGVMFTYESLCNIGFYNEEFEMREGHELMNRFTKKYKLAYLEAPLYRYRIHDNNRTNNVEKVKKRSKRAQSRNV